MSVFIVFVWTEDLNALKFAFTIVCVYNRLRVDGALVSFAIECISGHTSHSLPASLLKTATKIAALQRPSQGWQYLKSRKLLLFSVIVSVCNTVTSTNDTTTAPQPRHVLGKMSYMKLIWCFCFTVTWVNFKLNSIRIEFACL